MSPDRLLALRKFFAAIEPRLPEVVALMYIRLFAVAPEAASMFKGNIKDQQRRYGLMLQSIIKLTRSSHLWPVSAFTGQASVPAVDMLGTRHADAGVVPEHFQLMKQVLCDCCAAKFAKEFTPAAQEALGFIFDVMSRSLVRTVELTRANRDTKNKLPDREMAPTSGDLGGYLDAWETPRA
jgi:hemoglobin-like flavoprotein